MELIKPATVKGLNPKELKALSENLHIPTSLDFQDTKEAITARFDQRLSAYKQSTHQTYMEDSLEAYRQGLKLLKRIEIRGKLLQHGDLYPYKNLLSCERRRQVLIDPVPCVGDREFDVGFWLNLSYQEGRLLTELSKIAQWLGLDEELLLKWAAVFAATQLIDCRDERRLARLKTWHLLLRESA